MVLRYFSRVALIVAAVSVGSAASADLITVQGSTTFARRLLQPHQAELEAMTGHQFSIIPNKSGPGLLALLEGRADLVMLSAPVDAEAGHLRRTKPELPYEKLRSHEVDRTRVSVAVHPDNPVRSATLSQVKDILQGNIASWRELGGADIPIRAVLVGGGGGVTVAVQSALLDGQQATAPNKILVQTPVQLVQVVAQEPGAVGFAQLALISQKGLPELSTDKPIEQVLYFATLGEPSQAAASLIKASRTIAERLK